MYRFCELNRLFHPVEIASGTRGSRYHNPGLDRVLSSGVIMIHRLDWLRRSALVAVILPMLICPVISAEEPSIAVRIPERFTARAESSSASPDLRMDYGSFQWWLLDSDGVADLHGEDIAFQIVEHPYVLTLGEERFDPLVGLPNLAPTWTGAGNPGPDLHLIQAVAPIRPAWLDELRSLGLIPLQYIHPFTYVVWGAQAEIETSERLRWVRWQGEFAPAYRVLPRWRRLDSSAVESEILVPNAANPTRVTAELEAIGATSIGSARLNATWTIVTIVLPSDSMAAAAAIPGVYSIQPSPTDGGARGEMSNQVCAGNIDGGNLAFPGYPSWLDTLGLDGAGVIMANVDQGADENHPDLVGRFVQCTGTTCGGAASSSHGTHTAAIQAATGGSGVSSSGFLRALGMAPGARLVEQLYSPFYSQPDGMLLLMAESFANGATMSNNSWGPSGTPHGYDNDTMQTDIGVRDVDPGSAGNQALTYVLSIMNGYGGTSSQGTPDEAKNVIAVGSTKMQTTSGAQILEIDDLSTNSAHGPALDGRHLPQIVAPGCRVDSAVPSGYGLSCGTSMSSPHVTGTAALLVEQWRREHGTDPSPAMIKAELTVAARDLADNLDADGGVLGHVFDSKQGWGRLDTEAVLDPPVGKAVFDAPVLLTETGDEWIFTLAVDSDAHPVKVMLVWTDAPGHGLGGSTPAWNNDLDLVIEADGVTYPGNSFSADGWSLAGITADGMNNTEGVFLPPATTDEIRILVRASNLGSDGVPGNTHPTDQDFALVVSNAVQAPCEPGTTFHGNLSVTDVVIAGAQAFDLDWLPATTRCGGKVSYTVNDSRIGDPGVPLISTTSTAVTIAGGSPGGLNCFTVSSTEDGAPGQGSDGVCVIGTGLRRAGDLDCDGAVTATDIELVVATIFGDAEPTCAGFPAGDADLDGEIDAADPAQLVRAIHDPL
jgi:serine protease AprX